MFCFSAGQDFRFLNKGHGGIQKRSKNFVRRDDEGDTIMDGVQRVNFQGCIIIF